MRLIDKIALNRLLNIIANFILGVIKIIFPKSVKGIDSPKPDKRWKPRWRKQENE